MYNDIRHPSSVRKVAQYMRKKTQKQNLRGQVCVVWMGDLNRHHLMWDGSRNFHLFTWSNLDKGAGDHRYDG